MKYKLLFTLLAAFVGLLLTSTLAHAQYSQSYGSYYQKKVRQPGRSGPGTNVNSYLYDKYFYGKRAVNPTMSLNRRSSVSSYYQYVRPEQERREAFQQAGRQYVQQRKLQGNVGHTNYGFARELRQGVPSASDIPRSSAPSPYYNQWYGNQRR